MRTDLILALWNWHCYADKGSFRLCYITCIVSLVSGQSLGNKSSRALPGRLPAGRLLHSEYFLTFDKDTARTSRRPPSPPLPPLPTPGQRAGIYKFHAGYCAASRPGRKKLTGRTLLYWWPDDCPWVAVWRRGLAWRASMVSTCALPSRVMAADPGMLVEQKLPVAKEVECNLAGAGAVQPRSSKPSETRFTA